MSLVLEEMVDINYNNCSLVWLCHISKHHIHHIYLQQYNTTIRNACINKKEKDN